MLLRNTGAETIAAIPRFIPVSGDPNNFIDLPSVSLGPNQIAEVDLEPLKSAVYGRSDFDHVSIRVLNTGSPGSLIGALNGKDTATGMTYDVPLRDMGGIRNSTGAYPWRLDHDLSTVVSITNVAPVQSEVVVQINYPGGPYLLNPRRLAAGETAIYDLKKIRNQQIPDLNGHTIPLSVTGGQFKWFIHGAGSGRLIGRAEMLGSSEGISSSYSCPGGNCPAMFSYAWLDPDDVFLGPGDVATIHVNEIDCDAFWCYGPFSANVTSWDVIDPFFSVLFYGYGADAQVVGVDGGTAYFQANIGYDQYAWDGMACIYGGINIANTSGQAKVLKVKIVSTLGDDYTNTTKAALLDANSHLLTQVNDDGSGAYQWSIEGTYQLTNSSLTDSNIKVRWAQEGTYNVSVTYTSHSKHAQAAFKVTVARPTLDSLSATETPPQVYNAPTQCGGGTTSLSLGCGNTVANSGIIFSATAKVPQKFISEGGEGKIKWVQIGNSSSRRTPLAGGAAQCRPSVTTWKLDKDDPYASSGTVNNLPPISDFNYSAGTASIGADDSPFNSVDGYSPFIRTDSFKMYVVYFTEDDQGHPRTQRVIGVLQWSWSGEADYNSQTQTYSLNSGNYSPTSATSITGTAVNGTVSSINELQPYSGKLDDLQWGACP